MLDSPSPFDFAQGWWHSAPGTQHFAGPHFLPPFRFLRSSFIVPPSSFRRGRICPLLSAFKKNFSRLSVLSSPASRRKPAELGTPLREEFARSGTSDEALVDQITMPVTPTGSTVELPPTAYCFRCGLEREQCGRGDRGVGHARRLNGIEAERKSRPGAHPLFSVLVITRRMTASSSPMLTGFTTWSTKPAARLLRMSSSIP